MPFFSVIIPTYNRADLISETIHSVLGQTFIDFEILVVDDGSTDDTGAIVTRFFGGHEKVRYFLKQNEERGAARNFGLEKALGEFALFFDSDDLMKPDYLSTLYEVIRKTPGIHFLATKYDFLLRDGQHKPAPIQSLAEGWYDRDFFLAGNILACNYCIRIKDKLFKPFPPQRELSSMEDWLFILLNTERFRLFIKDKVCMSMREHDDRSMGNNQRVIEARQKATDWVVRELELSHGEEKKIRAWSHYFCGIHEYLDHHRAAAVKEACRAIAGAGVNRKFILLFFKSVIGRKWIQRLR
ncbi:MAG: glycosyltransferase family 2 protein [Chitinophagales bacterium]|nr:glycosyltransferase family 2 protein [Chitinophagales bacterium]